ncbi:hypothetical protein BDK51DRAFT_13027, partial [Blyttiomyces helicus]
MSRLDMRWFSIFRGYRTGLVKYGVETGCGPVGAAMAKDLGLPAIAGDPVRGMLSCTIMHSGNDGC